MKIIKCEKKKLSLHELGSWLICVIDHEVFFNVWLASRRLNDMKRGVHVDEGAACILWLVGVFFHDCFCQLFTSIASLDIFLHKLIIIYFMDGHVIWRYCSDAFFAGRAGIFQRLKVSMLFRHQLYGKKIFFVTNYWWLTLALALFWSAVFSAGTFVMRLACCHCWRWLVPCAWFFMIVWCICLSDTDIDMFKFFWSFSGQGLIIVDVIRINLHCFEHALRSQWLVAICKKFTSDASTTSSFWQ